MSQTRGIGSPSSNHHTSPHHNQATFSSPEEHWQAILRYDTQRRQSLETRDDHPIPDQNTTTTLHKPGRVKRMSLGDDLPHMPEEYQKSQEAQNQSKYTSKGVRNSPSQSVPRTEAAKYADALTSLESNTNDEKEQLTLGRQVTPPAFRGENEILVNRELQRLREQKPMKQRMYWRVVTGTMLLLVLGFSAYVFAQSVRAYLSLSPSTWFLSDSRNGTQKSPDPLLRNLALIETIASAIALVGMLASGFYLRMTRRRTCGRHLIWFAAILSTTISLALSLANIALIVAWHKQYSKEPNDPLARTRDVGQRCNGIWDLDILWSAAKSSLLAKPSDESVETSNCTRDPTHSVQMFLIAGGVRLAVFVVLCSIWLICLGRYNLAQEQTLTSNESINESPEMHQLLAEEKGGLPEMPTMQSMPGKYYDEDMDMVTFYEEEKKQSLRYSGSTWNEKRDDLIHMPEHPRHSNATLVEAPPKLQRFQWQRGEASQMQSEEQVNIYTYGNLGRHDRDQSAGAWSTNIMDRLWHALWGSTPEHGGSAHDRDPSHTFRALSVHEESELQHPHAWQHQREDTRLGVRGWFARDASGAQSRQSEDEEDEKDLGVGAKTSAYLEASPMHTRTSSQERRATQDRHEATRKIYERQQASSDHGDRFTNGQNGQNTARKAAYERSLRRKQEQKDRIEFLASLGREEDIEDEYARSTSLQAKEGRLYSSTNSSDRSNQSPNRDQNSKSTQSNGDQLVHMPNLQSTSDENAIKFTKAERSEEEDVIDESAFWFSSPTEEDEDIRNKKKQINAPVFVRQLGKLVRQLSAIESVGSGGERSQHFSRNSREPSSASGLY